MNKYAIGIRDASGLLLWHGVCDDSNFSHMLGIVLPNEIARVTATGGNFTVEFTAAGVEQEQAKLPKPNGLWRRQA